MTGDSIEERKAKALEGLLMHLEWQNALMAQMLVEMDIMRMSMVHDDVEAGEKNPMGVWESAMERTQMMREVWIDKYHRGVYYDDY
jgi:hypothetical protein